MQISLFQSCSLHFSITSFHSIFDSLFQYLNCFKICLSFFNNLTVPILWLFHILIFCSRTSTHFDLPESSIPTASSLYSESGDDLVNVNFLNNNNLIAWYFLLLFIYIGVLSILWSISFIYFFLWLICCKNSASLIEAFNLLTRYV